MNQPMSFTDAKELCMLRIAEDNIPAHVALREFRELTHCDLRMAEPIYRHFQKVVAQRDKEKL